MQMSFRRLVGITASQLLLGTAIDTAGAQTRIFPFSTFSLPHWNADRVDLYNCSGADEWRLFSQSNGTLHQRLTPYPTCQAFFGAGSLPQGITNSAGLDRSLPTYVEARLAVVGGLQATPSPGGIPIMWLHTIGKSALLVDVNTGTVGIEHAGGVVWTSVPGGIAAPHTYRMEVQPNAGNPTIQLWIDGATVAGPLAASIDWVYDGWAFGDGSLTPGDAIDIDWDYYSISQHPPGIGMPNTASAMLFAYQQHYPVKNEAAPGLPGPFRVARLAGNSMTLEWSGQPGSPFGLLLAPTPGLPRAFGCGGTLDIGTQPGFADVSVAFDPTIPVFGSLFTLSASGYSQQTLAVPSIPPGMLLGAIQGVVFAPGSCGYRLTAAFELRS